MYLFRRADGIRKPEGEEKAETEAKAQPQGFFQKADGAHQRNPAPFGEPGETGGKTTWKVFGKEKTQVIRKKAYKAKTLEN